MGARFLLGYCQDLGRARPGGSLVLVLALPLADST